MRIKLIIILLFALIPISLNCQTSCLPSGQTAVIDQWIEIELDIFPGVVKVKVKGYPPNMEIDWSTFENVPNAPSSIVKKLLEFEAAFMVAPHFQPPAVPDFWFSYIYTKSNCYAIIKSYVKISESRELDCCDADPSILKDITTHFDGSVTHEYYPIIKNINCGEKCCRTSYVFDYIQPFLPNPRYAPRLVNIVPETYTPCTPNNTQYLDCLSGLPVPCLDRPCN